VVVYGSRQRSRQDPFIHYPLERLPRMERGQLFKELLTVLLRMLNQRRLLWCYLGCGAGYPHPLSIILPAP
jgi:hypothetical protein